MRMKRIFASIFLTLELFAGSYQQSRADVSPLVQTRLMAEHLLGKFDGIAIITLDGKMVYTGSFGDLKPRTHLKASLKTPWRLASITKQITAVLVMQEVERGHFTLDDRIGDLLPRFRDNASKDVTVRQLLQHTSGLADPSETTQTASGVPTFYSVDKADHVFCEGPPRAAVGGFHYNNCDYYILADILETKTGKHYATLVEERIAKPLKLSTLRLYTPGETEALETIGEKGSREPPYHMASFEAAAGLRASADDLLTFDNALIAGKLLSPASLKVLWQGDPKLGYVALGAWSYTVKATGCATPLTLVERRGAVGNVNVLNLLWPDRHAALIVFSNNGQTDWGQLWQDSGLMRDLVVKAWCK